VSDVGQADLLNRRSLQFTGIHIEKWRNFSNLNVPLRRRLFIVGPNAAGKSNFIDSFRFLSDIVTVGGGFQSAVARRGGVSMLRSFSARRYPAIRIYVSLGNEEFPREWEYDLKFGQDNQRRPVIQHETVKRRGKTILDRPLLEDQDDQERLRQTHLEQTNVNREFRQISDFFATVKYLHIVPQLIREPDRSFGKNNDPFGGDFLEQIASTPKRTRDSRFKRITEALKVAVPQLEELDIYQDVRGVPHIRGRYKHWRPHGAWQTEEHFSDGTLRLLGLLWAAVEGPGPLLLEEPELSLHSEVVRHIPQMFANVQRRTGRQIFLSTHSPELLGDPGIGPAEVLVLTTPKEGTVGTLASDIPELVAMHDSGIDLTEAVMSYTSPGEAAQIALFGK
jgi:predicted ATPase